MYIRMYVGVLAKIHPSPVYSHTICTFIFLEMHRKTYRQLRGLDDKTL